MSTLILANACRYEMQFEYLGRQGENIIDMLIDPGTDSRDAAILSIGKKIIDSWTLNVLALLSNALTATNLHFTNLVAADASTGDITAGFTRSLPFSGELPSDPLPSNVAIRVDKQILGVRGARSGRMFLAGVPENQQASGQLSPASVANMNAALAQFLTDISITSAEYNCLPIVIHQPQIGAPTDSFVTGYSTLQPLHSQGRRLRF